MLTKRLALAAVSLAAATTLAACGDDDGSSSSDAVATVNGTDITSAQVDEQFEILAAQNAEDPPEGTSQEEFDLELTISGLNQLIFAQILLDNAAEMGVEATEDDIEATRQELIVQAGGEDELYKQLEERGMDRDEVDRQIEIVTTQDLIADTLVADVTDEEIESAYEEGASSRHILVEDEAAADEAMERLDSGEDFADVAADVSTDETSATNGGDLGFKQPGTFVTEFDDALFGADEGEVVGPIETQFGFHIIEHLAKPALDEVEEEIRTQLEQLRNQGAQQEFSGLLEEWVKAAEVTIHDAAYGTWDSEAGMVVAPETEDTGGGTPVPDSSETPGDGSSETENPSGDGGTNGE